MKRLALLVAAAGVGAAAGCVNFDQDLAEFCTQKPQLCSDGGSTGGGSAVGGGSATGGGNGGGSAMGGGNGGGSDVPCNAPMCSVQGYITQYPFFSIYSSSKNDVWIAGDEVDRWDGTSVTVLDQVSQYRLFAITGSSPTDVWTGGGAGLPYHSSDTGMDWQSQAWDGGDGINGMYSRNPTEAYLISDYGLWSWDGANWEHTFDTNEGSSGGEYFGDLAGSPSVQALWATKGSDVWHFDAADAGVGEVAPAGNSNFLYGLYVTAAGGVWAVGEFGTVLHRDPDTQAWSALTVNASPHESTTFFAVWAPSDSEAWVVGDEGAILRWRADAGWTKHDSIPVIPALPGSTNNSDISWFDVNATGNDMWIAGGRQFLDFGDYDAGVIAHVKLGP